MNDDPRFGFDDLPIPTRPARSDPVEQDRAADRHGFISREARPLPPKRRMGTTDPLHNFTMRLAMRDAEKFIRWCEGFARLVPRIEQA